MIEQLWWAPGIRPGSTHYKGRVDLGMSDAMLWRDAAHANLSSVGFFMS